MQRCVYFPVAANGSNNNRESFTFDASLIATFYGENRWEISDS